MSVVNSRKMIPESINGSLYLVTRNYSLFDQINKQGPEVIYLLMQMLKQYLLPAHVGVKLRSAIEPL
ncbi:hypothetical protein AX768_11930 [Burkholderia sp. PAMC 28687]|nr:hypothetical protein AX768_11930 [Burkholderia sp. PAMC 28687]